MRRSLLKRIVLVVFLLFSTSSSRAEIPRADDDSFFETNVRPVLAGKCFKCHGPTKASGGLRLDSRASILKGGASGPAAVPGDVAISLMLRAIRHLEDSDLKMPPSGKLPDSVVADLTSWVKRGMAWPSVAHPVNETPTEHWAFRPVATVKIPEDKSEWAANPIDCFIAARRQAAGLVPMEPASKTALIRRLKFDLVGLPPTPAEVDRFLADRSPDAYARLVERLLASPEYGERWGRHWMDVVRYADTAGDNADYPVPEAALYRDYIIRSFNSDKPYDQFVREQLAGDLLAEQGSSSQYADHVVATTFLGLARRYLTAPYESWELTLEDVIDTTGRAFMGLTLRCARCHDHKFDPVTKEDYYALYGIFASTQFPYAGSEEFASMKRPREHFVPLCPPAQARPQLEERTKKLAQLRQSLTYLEKESPPARRVAALDAIIKTQTELMESLRQPKAAHDDVALELKRERSERARWNEQLHQSLRAPRAELATIERTNLPANLPGAYGVCEGKPGNVAIQIGGDPGRLGPVVPRGAPKFLTATLGCAIPAGASGRLEFARWLTDPRNPLLARVMVNRIWQYHFGRGLVGTPSNFGLRGEPPTHPQLLDWLTRKFIDSGWSIKGMHRLIVHSQVYQLATTSNDPDLSRDPSNRWYWRFDRRRLDAESIRDAVLAVSGDLESRMAGPQPFPTMNTWAWTQHSPFKDLYATRRRSVYLMTQRLQRHPFLALFDGPDTNVTTDVRGSSTVPLQALYLMNNSFVLEEARAFARRVVGETVDQDARIGLAYRLALGRPPGDSELQQARAFVNEFAERARQLLPEPGAETETWTSLAHVLMCSNEFVYVD